MLFFPVIILALVQGITEFLPISSSGHLVLTHFIMNDSVFMSAVHQKTMDIAVHVGTLIAVMVYFREDLMMIVKGGCQLATRKKTIESRLALHVIIASIPVLICGLILFQFDFSFFDSLHVVAWMTLVFGVVLYFADRSPELPETVERFSLKQAMIYGLSQCLALIPGVSRAGITMTAGRFLGHRRVEAARFSLLLGMVAIAGAGLLTGLSLASDITVNREFLEVLGVGMLVSCAAAYITIVLMMRWVSQSTFTPFVVYRVILGLVLLGLLYSGVIPQDI